MGSEAYERDLEEWGLEYLKMCRNGGKENDKRGAMDGIASAMRFVPCRRHLDEHGTERSARL